MLDSLKTAISYFSCSTTVIVWVQTKSVPNLVLSFLSISYMSLCIVVASGTFPLVCKKNVAIESLL